jgi:diguanylate cyclase (GGDEF)-like protein
MISIKRHIDNWKARPETAGSGVAAYLSLLSSVIQCGARAVPGIGLDPDRKLSGIASALKRNLGPAGPLRSKPNSGLTASLEAANQVVRSHLSGWADRAFERHQTNGHELGEMVAAMRDAVDSLTTHSELYKQEAGDLAQRLHSITSMDDLTLIRQAIVDTANSLTACVARTAQEGRKALDQLRGEMQTYRTRLSDSEKLSSLDALTGLANRRSFEERLAFRVRAACPFSLILIDLNGFKDVNDRLGHLAGDEVMRSVAVKLRVEFPSADLVARWGGDEFAVIVNCSQKDAEARVDRIRRAPIGECRVMHDGKPLRVSVNAAFGVVAWSGSETGAGLLARADSCMYRQKRARECPASHQPAK